MFGFGLQSIEPIDRIIVLGISILMKERNMLVAEQFIQRLATEHGKNPVRTVVAVLGIHKPINS
jgi:hypothetical protein